MTRLSLEQSNTIVSAALAQGREMGLKPLSVAVLDAGGHLIAFQRQDGASILRPQIAIGKAGGTLALEQHYNAFPFAFASGAVGVTGDTSDNDEVCALAGIAAAGLKPQG